MMKEPIFQLRDVEKWYSGRRVLAIDKLEIWNGEILAIVGPSGAGKSTMLRLLNFLETPDHGSITFAGAECSAASQAAIDLRRKVTTVFQRPQLLNRNVRANVGLGLGFRGRRNHQSVTTSALKQVGMLDFADAPACSLSGGEAQRVALARAIVLEPDVLLLDEPTANLDPYNVSVIEDTIKTLNQEQGTTLVMVTHNIFQARRLADRVALLLEGQIIEINPVQQFFDHPQDNRTQQFVAGEMIY
jgi:tungstate transport system ATP-binding protein